MNNLDDLEKISCTSEYFNPRYENYYDIGWVNDDDDWIDFKKLLQTSIIVLNEKKSLMNYAD